jgi:hypothetical protein
MTVPAIGKNITQKTHQTKTSQCLQIAVHVVFILKRGKLSLLSKHILSNSLDFNERFGETCHLYLQGSKISEERSLFTTSFMRFQP